MNGEQIQDLFLGMSMRMQLERAQSQMTLGSLIAVLEKLPPGSMVDNLTGAHSYRGYYDDLAFERGEGQRPAADLLADCRASMGDVFVGYKGGEFVMGARTPLWIAAYGSCGEAIVSLSDDGSFVTKSDE